MPGTAIQRVWWRNVAHVTTTIWRASTKALKTPGSRTVNCSKMSPHKATFFAAASALELAKPGTLALLPPAAQLRSLRADYAGTAEMIFGKAPTFDHILEVLAQMNTAINY